MFDYILREQQDVTLQLSVDPVAPQHQTISSPWNFKDSQQPLDIVVKRLMKTTTMLETPLGLS